MALLLNIDTATENASVSLSENETCLGMLENNEQKDHAAWLHPGIQTLLSDSNKKIGDIEAVGITAGPGSYTGLRVGMAAAKGLCYALHIPLITVNTLEAMAGAALHEEADFFCPMIDARRLEVYTAVYDKNLSPVILPCAMILHKNSLSAYVEQENIIFFGNGQKKFQELIPEHKAMFKNIKFNACHLSKVIYNKFVASDFTLLAYAEPFYLKEFNFS